MVSCNFCYLQSLQKPTALVYRFQKAGEPWVELHLHRLQSAECRRSGWGVLGLEYIRLCRVRKVSKVNKNIYVACKLYLACQSCLAVDNLSIPCLTFNAPYSRTRAPSIRTRQGPYICFILISLIIFISNIPIAIFHADRDRVSW
jgi:hypothetical protein